MEGKNKEAILRDAVGAFKEGVGEMTLSAEGEEFVARHYSERLGDNEREVVRGWAEFGATALRKIRLAGRESANQAIRRGLEEVTTECVEASFVRIETVAASAWC